LTGDGGARYRTSQAAEGGVTDSAAGTAPRRFGALAEANYRFFLAGYGLSWIAYWVHVLAVGWYAWETTHSAFWLGFVFVCDLCPALLISPIGGALADRLDRIALLRGVLWLQVLTATLISLLAWLGLLPVWLLALFVALEGGLVGISQPAFHGLVPRLVRPENLSSAIALNTLAIHLSGVAGPLVAGIFFAFGLAAAGPVFLANAVGTLFYLWCLGHVRFAAPPPQARSQSAAGIRHEIAEGFRYMGRTRFVLAALGLTAAVALLARTLTNMLPGLNDRYAILEPARFVWLTAALLAGSVAASLVKAGSRRLGQAGRQAERAFRLYALLWASGFALLWWLPADPLAALGLLFLLGFTSTSATVGNMVELQSRVDEDRRGRVMGNLQMVSRGAGALGALLAGLLAGWIDFAPTFLVLLAVALALFVAGRRAGGGPA